MKHGKLYGTVRLSLMRAKAFLENPSLIHTFPASLRPIAIQTFPAIRRRSDARRVFLWVFFVADISTHNAYSLHNFIPHYLEKESPRCPFWGKIIFWTGCPQTSVSQTDLDKEQPWLVPNLLKGCRIDPAIESSNAIRYKRFYSRIQSKPNKLCKIRTMWSKSFHWIRFKLTDHTVTLPAYALYFALISIVRNFSLANCFVATSM